MSDKLRAAAGRLVDPRYAQIEAAIFDMRAVGKAYLADHPADDAEPLTEDWLRAAGFCRPMQVAAGTLMVSEACVSDDRVTRLPVVGVEFPRRKAGAVPVWRVWVYGHPRDHNDCPTRGHIRRLCAALGAPLAESCAGAPA